MALREGLQQLLAALNDLANASEHASADADERDAQESDPTT